MNKIISYSKSYLMYLILLVIYILIISLIFYFELINYKTLSIINYIVNLILFFIVGFKSSSYEHKKGYLNGFLSSSILIVLFLIITLFISKFNTSNLVYYISLICSSIVGGIIGVSK